MACLKININRIKYKISALALRLYSRLGLSVYKLNSKICVYAYKLNFKIHAHIYKASRPIKVNCALVCSGFNNSYLIVTPKTVQWISEYIEAEYFVRSNVNWIVYSN